VPPAGRPGAGTRITRPAAHAQYGGDVGRGLASAITQVEKSEPERNDAEDRVSVIAALVSPLLVGGMRRGPVDLHSDPELLIEVVEVSVASALADSHLSAS